MSTRANAIVVVALAAISGVSCKPKQEDRLVGKWTVADRIIEFKATGQFILAEKGKEQTGEWHRDGPDVSMSVAGQEMTCAVPEGLQNQLRLAAKEGAPKGCKISAPYWRMDLPAEKRTASIVAFSCETKGQRVGQISYTPAFRVEADKDDYLACFGQSSSGCNLLASIQMVRDDYFSMFVTWGNGTGDMFRITQKGVPPKLELAQSSSDSCGVSSGLSSCSFAGFTPIGTCEKVSP